MKPSFTVLTLLAGLSLSGAAQATLIDQGDTAYDTDLNISWLKNANLAASNTFFVSGINSDGTMTWNTALSWIGAMNTANYLGYSDWRLPTVTDTGASGCDFAYSGTDCGYNVDTATGEMAHLFYDELGNLAYYDTSGGGQAGYGLANTGPFNNLQSDRYWSGTEYAQYTGLTWYFGFGFGRQSADEEFGALYALAVRPGQVAAVPEPGSALLFGVGLLGLLCVARRRRG